MLNTYITDLNTQYTSGKATEHSYRPLLKTLLETLLPKLNIINEPKRQACGAPDYILTHADLPIGFIETKDINDKDLKGKKSKNGNKEQFDRYKKSLTNLIFTDYLTFHFYRNEELLHSVTIAKATDKGITPLPENFDTFLTFVSIFSAAIKCYHQGIFTFFSNFNHAFSGKLEHHASRVSHASTIFR